MNRIAVFGGTAEGRECAELLAGAGYDVCVFVATAYGEDMLYPQSGLAVRSGRLDFDEMSKVLKDEHFDAVIDATHPYAVLVTENLIAASSKANIFYLRVERGMTAYDGAVTAKSAAAAAELLNDMDGRILLTTGSKELEAFTSVKDWKRRVFARILPTADVLRKCEELGFSNRNLICMHGPFTHDINVATIKMLGINILVTKDTGEQGGFPEKLSAARECGAGLLVIERPAGGKQASFVSVGEAVSIIKNRLPVKETEINSVSPRFPLFISLAEKNILIAGGGKVAARRARTLLDFGANITVVAPEISYNMRELLSRITWKQERCGTLHEGYAMVIAATNDRDVNRRIGEDAKKAGIPVSVADAKDESTFWFPAIAKEADIVCGLVSKYGNHAAVKSAAEKIRKTLSEGL